MKLSRKQKSKYLLIVVALLAATSILVANYSNFLFKADTGTPTKNIFSKRYVFWEGWVSRAVNRNQLLAMMDQAAAAGYNGIVVNDYDAVYKWGSASGTQTENGYRQQIEDKAKALGLVLIPAGQLQNGINEGTTTSLAEAFPVDNTNFVVQDGTATVQQDPSISYPNSGFENWNSDDPNNSGYNQPVGLTPDEPGVASFRETDPNYVRSGSSSIRFQDVKNFPDAYGVAHGRVMNTTTGQYAITVPEFQTYQVSVWLKTENLAEPTSMNFMVYGYDANGTSNPRQLYANRDAAMGIGTKVQSTQDWTQYTITFNSLDKTKIRLYFGSWPSSLVSATGKYWFDDVSISEVGLYNTVRRDSLPLVVTSDDGSTTYTEGSDYTFQQGDRVHGVLQDQLIIPPGSLIQNGQTLKVSWYQYANVASNQPLENMCHQEYWDKLTTDIGHLNSVYPDGKGFMINYDEWRMANWDPACKAFNNDQDMTGGEYMAYAMQQTEAVYKNIKPSTDLYVWNDMFDPYSNAVPIYFAVNGSINNVITNGIETHQGSWSGLSPNTEIMNWNHSLTIDPRTNESKSASSLKFFAGLGNHQTICDYYDQSNLSVEQNSLNTLNTLESQSGGISGIDGYMYTTWNDNKDGTFGNYNNLADVANFWKATDRWGTNSLITSTITPPSVDATHTVTYKETYHLTGEKSSDLTHVYINGAEATSYTDTTWASDIILSNISVNNAGGDNTVIVVGEDSTSNSSTPVTVNLNRHKLGDATGDGTIDYLDLSKLATSWNKDITVGTNYLADFNEDGTVNYLDFSTLATNWKK